MGSCLLNGKNVSLRCIINGKADYNIIFRVVKFKDPFLKKRTYTIKTLEDGNLKRTPKVICHTFCFSIKFSRHDIWSFEKSRTI